MGECGCSSNNIYYMLPARSGLVYLITLSRACVNCDAPPGVTIERFEGQPDLLKKRFEGVGLPGMLPFEKWHDCDGVCIQTGYRRQEFVAALKSSLVGMNTNALAPGKHANIDKEGAEILLEEMYPDSTPMPFVVESKL